MKILKSLNYVYSLRHLESLIGISYQNLWKYINMLTIPSDEIAIDILTKLNNLKIVEKTINEFVDKNKDNVNRLASDIGFLSLYVLKIEDYLKEQDISTVIPLSDYAIPFAAILAWELGLRLCTPMFSKGIKDPKIKIVWYYSSLDGELKLFPLSRICVDEEADVLLVDIMLNDVEKIKAVAQLLKSSNINVKGVATVYVTKECAELISKTLTSSVFYISVI